MVRLFDKPKKVSLPQEKEASAPRRKSVRVVGTQLPEEMYKLLEENLPKWGYVSVSDYLRDLIRRDLKEKGVI